MLADHIFTLVPRPHGWTATDWIGNIQELLTHGFQQDQVEAILRSDWPRQAEMMAEGDISRMTIVNFILHPDNEHLPLP